MHIVPDKLGDVIKSARKTSDMTMEELAAKVGITERYLYRIENEGKKPSFDILYSLVRELAIDADSIFYPDKPKKQSKVEPLARMLYICDERSLQIVHATITAALDSQAQK